mgnify:CR=1 FL=1
MIEKSGERFSGYNKPKATPGASKKSAVLAKEGGKVRIVRFGDPDMTIKKHIPDAKMEIGGGLNFYGFAYPATGVYDISRAQNELGYKPEYDLERGVADYLAALKQMKV